MIRSLLLGLEVVEDDAALLGLLAPVLNNDTGAVDDLAGVALTVKNAYLDYLSATTQNFVHTPCDCNLQRPAHSPSCFPSGTLIRGILCSEHRAMTSFL